MSPTGAPGSIDIKSEVDAMMASHLSAFESSTMAHLDSIVSTSAERLEHFEAVSSTRVAALESAATVFESWRPRIESSGDGVQSSVDSLKCEITKISKLWDREAKDHSSVKPGILGGHGSASARPSARVHADGPNGHRVDFTPREPEFGHVYVQTQLPANGKPEPDPPKFARWFGSPHDTTAGTNPGHGWGSGGSLGHLPKMHFPKFNGDNPKLWISRYEDYFDMYSVDPAVWIRVASMHFTDAAARWLQSIERRIKSLSWNDFVKLLLERFRRDHHELLIRQLFHIKQTSSVIDYIDRFTSLVDQLHAYESRTDPLYYTMRFVDGLRDDLKASIIVQRRGNLDTACVLAQLQEEVAPQPWKKEQKLPESSVPASKPTYKPYHPLPLPPRVDKSLQEVPYEPKKTLDTSRGRTTDDKLAALRAYRRAHGQCEKCAEKWTRGCGIYGYLFSGTFLYFGPPHTEIV
ncbi:hypothetical protein QOZ80_8BG0649810 [Eleusine coracana subsp. coracana]|nr:hypothetical protein QOZ80_8BG0649810 [Eleusine coracana subsp. coracana]